MPIIPKSVSLTKGSVDILNTIRAKSTDYYKNHVPKILRNVNGKKLSKAEIERQIYAIGETIMSFEPVRNEFLQALYGRIGKVLITSKSYQNPYRLLKSGVLEYGETIQDIFIDIINVQDFDPERAETEVFKRELPDVKSTFYHLNYQKLYKVTVERARLKQAFLSEEGVEELVLYIVDQMTSSMEYDEQLTTLYMIGMRALNGAIHVTNYPADASLDDIAATIKEVSNNWTFKKRKYNYAGVTNHSPKSDQIILVTSKFDAQFSTKILAWVFDKTEAEIGYNRILLDSYKELDVDRLDKLFENDPTYHHFTEEELSALDEIPCIHIDKDWLKIYDNDLDYGEIENPQGRYINHNLHAWKTFAISPFANATMYLPEVQSVTSVEVKPATASVYRGQTIKLTAVINGTDFADKRVTWSTNVNDVMVDEDGMVIIPHNSTSNTVTVTATSKADPDKSDDCTITIENLTGA